MGFCKRLGKKVILMLIALILIMIDMSMSVQLLDWMRFTLEGIILIIIAIEVMLRFDDWINSRRDKDVTIKKDWFRS